MAGPPTMTNALNGFLEALQAADGLDMKWGRLTEFMGGYGADVINYAVLNVLEVSREEASVTQFSNMSSEWIDYYLDQRMDLSDPHVRYVRRGGMAPYRWNEQRTIALTSDDERKVLLLAKEAGLRSQISMVAPDPLGLADPIGGMTIGSSLKGGEYFRAVTRKEDMLVAAAMLFHNHAIGEIGRQQVGARPLTDRERDCIAYVASGLRTARIAERLGVSEVTVEMHLQNVRKKLRARTTPQAVARAMIFGDISL
ncbi:helix-turn-helix transcriptional regulator [Sphingosinicella rhizophila]|uniref:LuxR C-terminal-related transcriptional regulator n=1 Tax=Sphingosinicella rhizophila TaxID=3050082 RepID=A0ABU3QA09_9SPHN|nr:LuxR C-terminal-related transcriptional regulator [Sphingosinicella sp. GR2756]MDT9600245.1 LuxR C-terminal-related transcriptional regulator [Sphingosinicella sp. GR2756]